MAVGKKSFILYSDLLDKIDMLTIEERGILFTHLLEYVNDKEPILTDRLLLTAWKPIELELKRDLKKYEVAKENKVNGGRLGNLKRWNTDLYEEVVSENMTLEEAEIIANGRKVSHSDGKVTLPIASVAVNDNVNVNVNDNVINNIKYNHQLIAKAQAFDIFWNAYNKKTDKTKSEIKFMKLSVKEIETILKVVEGYVLKTPDVKYRKSPLTWLNGKNWNDEVEVNNEISNQVYKPNNNLGTSNQIRKYND